jgi:hypothetical protein
MRPLNQGCQMVCFQTKNPNFGWSCCEKSWYILWPFGLFYSYLLEIFYGHLVYFVVIWYSFPRFGTMDQEKSGNPALNRATSILFCWSAKRVRRREGQRGLARRSGAGLPDSTFSYQKSQFGYILEGLGIENVGTFMVILWSFGICFPSFWYIVPRKIWQPSHYEL